MEVSEILDYPPRLLIYVERHEGGASDCSPEVQIVGLNKPISFKLPIFGRFAMRSLLLLQLLII